MMGENVHSCRSFFFFLMSRTFTWFKNQNNIKYNWEISLLFLPSDSFHTPFPTVGNYFYQFNLWQKKKICMQRPVSTCYFPFSYTKTNTRYFCTLPFKMYPRDIFQCQFTKNTLSFYNCIIFNFVNTPKSFNLFPVDGSLGRLPTSLSMTSSTLQ